MVEKRLIHTIRSMSQDITDKCDKILDGDGEYDGEENTIFEDIKEVIDELVEVKK